MVDDVQSPGWWTARVNEFVWEDQDEKWFNEEEVTVREEGVIRRDGLDLRFLMLNERAVVVKRTWCRDEQERDAVLRERKANDVEVAFYRSAMAKEMRDMGIRVPKVTYLQSDGEGSGQWTFVAEDVRYGSSYVGRHVMEMGQQEIRAGLKFLAQMHGRFLGRQEELGGLWDHAGYWSLDKRSMEWKRMESEWEKTMAAFEVEFPSLFSCRSVRVLAKALKDLASSFAQELENVPFLTLCHGDAKAANLYFYPPSQTVGPIDWQWAGAGSPAIDVVYLIHSSMAPELLQDSEEEYLHDYYDALCEGNPEGVRDSSLTWTIMLKQYQVAYLDYVRYLVGGMWGKVSPESCRSNADQMNWGMHKRSTVHFVRMVEKAVNFLRWKSPHIFASPLLQGLSLAGALSEQVYNVTQTILRDHNGARSADILAASLTGIMPGCQVTSGKDYLLDMSGDEFDYQSITQRAEIFLKKMEAIQKSFLHFPLREVKVFIEQLRGTSEGYEGEDGRVGCVVGFAGQDGPLAGLLCQISSKNQILIMVLGLGSQSGLDDSSMSPAAHPPKSCEKSQIPMDIHDMASLGEAGRILAEIMSTPGTFAIIPA